MCNEQSLNTTRRDLRWGAVLGVRLAIFYSIGAGLAGLIGGLSEDVILLLSVAYFAGGVASGALLGLLRKVATSSRFASTLLGMVVSLPASAAIMLVLYVVGPESQYDTTVAEEVVLHVFAAVFMSIAIGGYAGWYFGPKGEKDSRGH